MSTKKWYDISKLMVINMLKKIEYTKSNLLNKKIENIFICPICHNNIKIYTIDAEYERFINERIEYAPEVIKAFTDKKDDRFVYAVSIDKSYQKLKNTKELAEEIIEKILEEEE